MCNMCKKALIITAFINYDYNIRVKYLRNFLINKGYDVVILSSDFDHRKKTRLKCDIKNAVFITVPQYKTNMSLSRVYSHCYFSKNVFLKCKEIEPDLIYAITPPNYLFLYLKKYKYKNSTVKIICEIEDLWPESLPLNEFLKKFLKPIIALWSSIRNMNIKSADAIVFECDLFRKYLDKILLQNQLKKTIYLCKADSYKNTEILMGDEWRFLYLGSINNLIDINLIIKILKIANRIKASKLIIIGAGEKIAELVNKCNTISVDIIDYGIIYNDLYKQKIISKCHFALNIMKDTVFVGATMKSLEYFHFGVPVINNIPADTSKMIDDFACGFNIINKDNFENELYDFLKRQDIDSIRRMHINSRKVYEKYFSTDSFENSIKELIDELM